MYNNWKMMDFFTFIEHDFVSVCMWLLFLNLGNITGNTILIPAFPPLNTIFSEYRLNER